MASYENDSVITDVLTNSDLCATAEDNLIELLKAAPEAEGRVFNGPLTKSDINSLKVDMTCSQI